MVVSRVADRAFAGQMYPCDPPRTGFERKKMWVLGYYAQSVRDFAPLRIILPIFEGLNPMHSG
jgi:hypothetical protein